MYDDSALHAVDLLSREVAVIHPETPLPRVIQIMAERHVSGLPVEDHDGTIFGRITEGDLGLVRR